MRRPRILIIDDEPGLVRLMTLMLTRLNRYEIFTELDSRLALKAVARLNPHLVILDWIMATITGAEVAEQIRSNPRVSDTPILFLSAFIMKRDEPQEIAGFPALAKPFGLHELVEAIERELGRGDHKSSGSMAA
jgi:CheY-like chemotaxis protein